MAKVNKRRRSMSGGDVVFDDITVGADAGKPYDDDDDCHHENNKRWPMMIHNNFNKSFSLSLLFTTRMKRRICRVGPSSSSSSTCNTIILLLGILVILLGLGSNIHKSLLFHTQSQGMTAASTVPPITSYSLSSSIQAAAQQLQLCSNNGSSSNNLSFGELVHTHYQKMMQQQQPHPAHSRILKFVHIAKTGGTAIEMAAAAANISWGVCHWHNGKYYKNHKCPQQSNNNEPSRVKGPGPPKIAYWHKTSQHYDVRAVMADAAAGRNQLQQQHDNDWYDPYANATLFAVVRNPYNRIISEYYYETSRGNTPASILNNATRLNAWIQQLLRPLQGATMGYIQLVPTNDENESNNNNNNNKPILPANRNYYQRDSHYLPQYDYFYDGERRVARHAIHFENLSYEFRTLMVQYNLSSQIILPNVDNNNNNNNDKNKNKKSPEEMSGRHTQNKKLGLHNLTIETTRLVEFVYARDFVFFGYPARTHVLENQYQPGIGSIISSNGSGGDGDAARRRRRRLEFVHIPQTGAGRMIEMAAAAAQIPWGACHFRVRNDRNQDDLSWCPVANDDENNNIQLDPNDIYTLLPAQLKQEMKHHLWNLPSHYFEKLLLVPQLSTTSTTLDKSPKELLHNPYGDDNAALFVVVRNPYDRIISTYYAVQEEEEAEKQASNNNGMMMTMMNNATYMNEWLYRHLVIMRDTISTARQVDATSFPKAAYYQFAGRFMPQYDFVYDFVYNGTHGQRRVVDHVLHFESLATEFPALMNDYYHENNDHRHRRPVLPEIKDAAKLEALLECTKSRSLGIANLTLQNVRLIEFVYARDFAAFGYRSMTFHLENQYPINLPPTNE